MDHSGKTKEELIEELKKLQQECDLLRSSGENDRISLILLEKNLNQCEKQYQTLAEEKLTQALEWQNAIFEGSRDAIFISDRNSRFVAVNNAACNLTGYSREQLMKMIIPDIHDEHDLDSYNQYHNRILSGEELLSEAKILRSDGAKVDTEFNNKCILIAGKEYMHTTGRVITDRKHAEEEIKKIENLKNVLLDNLPIITLILKKKTREIVACNKLAIEAGAVIGKTCYSTLTNCEINCPFCKAPDLWRTDREQIVEAKHLGRFWEGRWIPLSEDLYIHYILDITERKNAEAEIHGASLYARNLIEASIDPLVTINAQGKIMDVNFSTEQITGISRDKLIGTDFADYFTDPTKARKGYKIVFSKGVVKDYPLTILHSSGRKITVLYNATLFKNEAGEVQGVFAAARDITDRKKMDEELRRSKKLLEKLNKHLLEIREDERSQIGLNLHDDLGQKLTAINLNITWIKSRIGVQSKAVRERIEEISKIIYESIESIREISSFLRPNILFDFGLVPAIKWQMDKFEQQSGIKCHFHHESNEIKIDTSVALILFRILQESLTNIARHSEATIAEVTIHRVKNKIEMLIKDNGIGIDKEKVNSLASMGIAGIKERIRSVGGSLLIKGKKGSWTFVKVSVPLIKRRKDD